MWDKHSSLKSNIEAVLDLSLPTFCKSSGGVLAAENAGGADCAICYNYRRPVAAGREGSNRERAMEVDPVGMEDSRDAPGVYCDNEACGKPFHKECLREWLVSDATTRQSFGKLFGACPYCSSPISVAR